MFFCSHASFFMLSHLKIAQLGICLQFDIFVVYFPRDVWLHFKLFTPRESFVCSIRTFYKMALAKAARLSILFKENQ